MSIVRLETERLVKAHIKASLKQLAPKGFIYMPVPNGMGMAGIPDFIVGVPYVIQQNMVGKLHMGLAGIEAKRANGKATKLQLHQLANIAMNGGFADIIRGSDDIPRSMRLMARNYGLQY